MVRQAHHDIITSYSYHLNTLFIDTASHEGITALCTKSKQLGMRILPHQDEAAVMPTIEAMLQEAGKGLQDLRRIACVTGPGGFSSIRTGVATANALSYALKIPIGGIHLSDVWNARLPLSSRALPKQGAGGSTGSQSSVESPLDDVCDAPTARGKHVLWLHSTRRTHLFVRSLSDDLYKEPTLIDLETAQSLKGTWIGELIDAHRDALPNVQPLSADQIKPLEEVLPELLTSLTYANTQIEAWYGREA
jgi:tRNA threonylcarbamoyl adenosine modification protein YeaZ